jgi:putative FmdB family regulatory protein
MPMYEYACRSCDERFEELVRASAPAVACPACGSSDAERLLSRFTASARPAQGVDYSRMGHHARAGGCCGGGCGHAH